jgi:hypothetical protein
MRFGEQNRVLTPHSPYSRRREDRESSYNQNKKPPSFPLRKVNDIAKPDLIYDSQRPCAAMWTPPYKLNDELAQSALHVTRYY